MLSEEIPLLLNRCDNKLKVISLNRWVYEKVPRMASYHFRKLQFLLALTELKVARSDLHRMESMAQGEDDCAVDELVSNNLPLSDRTRLRPVVARTESAVKEPLHVYDR